MLNTTTRDLIQPDSVRFQHLKRSMRRLSKKKKKKSQEKNTYLLLDLNLRDDSKSSLNDRWRKRFRRDVYFTVGFQSGRSLNRRRRRFGLRHGQLCEPNELRLILVADRSDWFAGCVGQRDDIRALHTADGDLRGNDARFTGEGDCLGREESSGLSEEGFGYHGLVGWFCLFAFLGRGGSDGFHLLLNFLADFLSSAVQDFMRIPRSSYGEFTRDSHVQEAIPLQTGELRVIEVGRADDAVGVEIGGVFVEKVEPLGIHNPLTTTVRSPDRLWKFERIPIWVFSFSTMTMAYLFTTIVGGTVKMG